MKLGRKRPLVVGPHLSWRNYLFRALPSPPEATSYWPQASAFLENILGNDIAGNCTIAAAFHADGSMLGNAGIPVLLTALQCLDLYKQLSGWNGIEGDPSDTGLDELTVLNWWAHHGLVTDEYGKHAISAYAAVNAQDPDELRTALWLMGNLYFALELPNEYTHPFPKSGDTWDVAGDPNPHQGHAFVGVDYTKDGVIVDTWGLNILFTWNAIAKYAVPPSGAVHACFGTDSINLATLKAPSGFDKTQLLADIQAIKAG